LNHGNYEALTQFLGKLRTNRVGAYVKLNLQESKGYFQKAATLLKPATKIIRERIRYGFVRLKKNMMV
jgi:RecA-family ATPase